MLKLILKYFAITLCSIYIFKKLQNFSFNKKNLTIDLFFSVIVSVTALLTRINLTYLTFVIIIFLLIMFYSLVYKSTFNSSVTFSTISVGISYIVFALSSFISAPVCYIIFNYINIKVIDIDTVTVFMIGLLQIILCRLLFQIKRFKNGIANYESKITSDAGVLISLLLLLTASLFNKEKTTFFMGTTLIIAVFIIGFTLLLWWKKHTTNIYLEKIHKRNIDILENSLAEQKEINENLKKHNEDLSGIIHRDNKIIPAMLLAVEEILSCKSADEQKEKSISLLNQLKTMSSERMGILTKFEYKNKKFPKTGITSVDASINYLYYKANGQNISFDFLTVANTGILSDASVSENDLNTLILDLGENAIIAASKMNSRNVLIVFGNENQCFNLSVYDSGNYFDRYVIKNLGLKRVTTRQGKGGTGIGLMTTFEILKRYNASFVLDETTKTNKYNKKISVYFDGCNTRCIRTAADRNNP